MDLFKNYRRTENAFQEILALIWILSFISATQATKLPLELNSTNNSDIFQPRNETKVSLFTWEDYSVLVAMLIISCAIGVFYAYFGEKQLTGDDFLLGGSSMGTFPMALSLAASFITAIELLGNPAEMYVAGGQFWMICLAFVLVIPVTSHLYLPVFMRLRLTSCYEYLEVRFCKSMRVYASALYMMQMILYTAVAVYAPALALSDVTGLNTYLAVSVVYIVCIFYASQGGMKAVIMTDTFQSAVLLGSLAAVLALGVAQEGGSDSIWDHARRTDRLHFFDMNPDPTVRHSFWSVVVGGTIYWISMFCANQASIQKYLSVERLSQARIALWVSAIGLVSVYSVNFATGALLANHYAGCDPIKAGVINASDRLLPLYVVRQLGEHPGVPGFFVAGIFAASLGTVASALNSLSAIACQDLATGLLGITLPEEKGAAIARWVCLGCGALSFALVFAVERLGPVLQLALSFNGMIGGVSLGLFSLGMLFPWANAKGAIAGGVFGLILVVAAGGGAQFAHVPLPRLPTSIDSCPVSLNNTSFINSEPAENHDDAVFWLFRVSYLWYTSLGCVGTLLIGLIVSVVTGVTDPADVPIDLISPPVINFLNSLPIKIKKALRVPTRMGSERRRSSSVRPPNLADDKDTRRRRRLSELAGGVFYSDAPTLTRGHDNLALGLDSEKPPPEEAKRRSFKLDAPLNPNGPQTSTC
ncbi:sodium-coupled monocarboxylate transporter 1 [Vanessa atalanta]|uniref:sodium-coupled monocarboxylate transporter 1 n=1 Tax=Vanessa atalanta TaxID=42275 RepID=UPI001FCDF8C8|nr:sodium-coupled monocarboxylate transporter 1 [Vanessa atalanta]XP_047527864.1 sodium-coupled monocarboxylate transporter 1 [Vanessa atalanta]XP_047527865.1 sodium-coupled monocarboxylate transporter 1 [Vanessa atalanta]